MYSGDFYTQMDDLGVADDGVADELNPFDASSDVHNFYVPDNNQGRPFQTCYYTSSGEPFLGKTGVYPSGICMPWFNGTETVGAIQRFPDRKLVPCHGRNFSNNMMLPPPYALNHALSPHWGPGSTKVALGGNELQGVVEINTNIKVTDGGMPNLRRSHWKSRQAMQSQME